MSARTELEMRHVAGVLAGNAFRFSNEVQLHELIASLLAGAGLSFAREHKLDDKNRLDFWLDGIVIEVKVDGSLGEALRQVDRYVMQPAVRGVVLATTKRWAGGQVVAQVMPSNVCVIPGSAPEPQLSKGDRPTLRGKPVQLVQLRRQSL